MRNKDIFGNVSVDGFIPPSIPYMGNKRKLATKILNSIYKTIGDFDYFYDLFAGGGSVSIAALMAGHNVHYNELNTGVANLMRYVREGGVMPNKWVTREEFFKHKDGNDWYAGYIKTVWSFGNRQATYLFGKNIEAIKKQAHEYLMENEYDGTQQTRVRLIKEFKEKAKLEGRFELERLERLRQLERLNITNDSYDNVEIKIGKSVIYCDPPYKGKGKYQLDIDHDKFYTWCLKNENPVFVSEYAMAKEFKKVGSFRHRCTLSATANNEVEENLYWNGKSLKK